MIIQEGFILAENDLFDTFVFFILFQNKLCYLDVT